MWLRRAMCKLHLDECPLLGAKVVLCSIFMIKGAAATNVNHQDGHTATRHDQGVALTVHTHQGMERIRKEATNSAQPPTHCWMVASL